MAANAPPATGWLTQSRLRQLLDYDPETGVFRWRAQAKSSFATETSWKLAKRFFGKEAGTMSTSGYRMIRLEGRNYAAHRLAWLYVHGRLPTEKLKHRNEDRLDNRLANLQEGGPTK
ncbi:MAG: HNH endonuclease [Chromatiaceae bacterium]|jgi:citrate synthase|nr:HNH endonuclease [Chromatiaceae bacterium]